MSLGALGQYGSDSSISDSEGDYEENRGSMEGNDKNVSPHCMDPLSLCREQELSDSDPDTSSHHSSPLLPPSPASPLPLPDIESIVAQNSSYTGSELHTSGLSSEELKRQHSDGELENKNSVFSNPYERAEKAKMAILKKHVGEFDKKPETKGSSPPPSRRHYRKKRVGNSMTPASVEAERNELFDENDSSLGAKKDPKHRSGVTDSLLPPKKYMRMYDKIYTK